MPFTEDPIENLRHMVMPAIVLGTGLSAILMRQMRSSMLTSLGADYVRTARAKGLPERSVLVAAAGYVIVNLTVDVLYSVLNPRIRVAGAQT